MNFFQPKKDFFALSFSDHQVQIAKAVGKGKLKFYSKKKLEPGVIVRGEIKNEEALQKALAELFHAVKVKDKFVVVGLPEVKAFTRSFKLPLLPLEELQDAVCWQSEPLLPFPLEKTYLDWMILEEEKEKKQVRVLVVALPQDLVEAYAKLLEKMSFQPVAFEITSLSLARMVKKTHQAALLMEIGEKEAILVVIDPKGGIEVSSTVAFGNESEALEEVSATAKNILAFYKKKVGEAEEKKVTKIFYCGRRAQTDLIKKIGQAVGLATFSLDQKQPQLATIISLAQKDVAAPIDEKTINLIPPRIQGIYDRAAKIREISFWLKLGLSALFLIWFGYSVLLARVYFGIKKTEGKLIELQASLPSKTKNLGERVKFLNAQAENINNLVSFGLQPVPLLFEAMSNPPEGITLKHISFDGEKNLFLIDGFAQSREKLLSFRQTLEKKDKFSKVYFPLSSLEKGADFNFTMSLVGKEKMDKN